VRVISGSDRGRRLRAVRGTQVRPTSDRVREALFSILASRFEIQGRRLLDLFAGTGALGIEALSRGAGRVVFVESARGAVRVLSSNLRHLGYLDRAEILAMPVERGLRELARHAVRFDGVFLDPPYGRDLIDPTLRSIVALDLILPGGWVMAETHVEDPIPENAGTLRLTARRRYGKTALALFVAESSTSRASLS
jgi:16S rRNA (guanine966-N2)-methyltransferase